MALAFSISRKTSETYSGEVRDISASSFDMKTVFGKDTCMSHTAQKFIAILFALWLPLFSGSALAASVAMQMPAGQAQDAMMADCGMDDMDMPQSSNSPNQACDSCAVCHMAYTVYIAVPTMSTPAVTASAYDATPYLLAFSSYSFAPLLPPPLARI